ncbi:hypothetical protein ACH9L7_17035 (plasmid) [Haloferax sp. S1W]|uniref:hypothetical protein n=1 Tax=Haloferax sp. S1W TaxID=3377110 RepID=UPI0037C903A3
MKLDVVEALHQPEYTGENRCEPCTVLNLLIAGLLGSVVARKSKLGGVVAVGLSIGLIYLRGYLVPGTPTLTKRYLPPEVLRWFGKDPQPAVAAGFGGQEAMSCTTDHSSQRTTADETGATDTTGTPNTSPSSASETDHTEPSASDDESERVPIASEDDLETFFTTHDILELCQDGSDLCLTDDFEAEWMDKTTSLADSDISPEAVTDAFGMDAEPESLELMTRGETQILKSDATWLGQWPSSAALIADIGASRVLAPRISEWSDYDSETKGAILNGLRMFLETCPTTGGDVHMGEEVVESCCSSHTVLALTCEETGERLFEHRLSADE